MANTRFRVSDNKAAIWTGIGDRQPFDDPTNHLDRLKFHSALKYVKVIQDVPVTLNLPARAAGFRDAIATYQLFQHGQGHRPGVFGGVVLQGELCAFAGSVPVQYENLPWGGTPYFARMLSVGADATWVYAYEFAVAQYSNNSFNRGYDAIALPLHIYITDQVI